MSGKALVSTGTGLDVGLRAAQPDDADACGRICYDAFRRIGDAHGFSPDVPSAEAAAGLIGMLIADSGFYAIVAHRGGEIVGSNFLDERAVVSGVGPVTVDPAWQDR